MRIKFLAVALLVIAIITVSVTGTLSNYSVTSSVAGADVNLDALRPDLSKMPDDVDICRNVSFGNKKNSCNNSHFFVAFYGDITQLSPSAMLKFGERQNKKAIADAPDFNGRKAYLLYFAPDAEIKLANGITVQPDGFYLISAGKKGTDLFDESLYEKDGNIYKIKDNSAYIGACTNPQDVCKKLDIPLNR